MHEDHINTVNKILGKEFGEAAQNIKRMTTGLANEVYLVTLPSRTIIVRLNADPNQMVGSERHIPLLKSKGIKVPDILASDYSKTFVPFAYQIQTKIEGQDIGTVINMLSDNELKGIAEEIAHIVDVLKTIPTNGKFGWIGNDDTPLYDTWLEILQPNKVIERDKKTGTVSQTYIDKYYEILERFRSYFEQVPSTFYYDDMSSKNVLIDHGSFAGLVDLDTMAYGDPLELIGRIEASWFGTNYGQTYTAAVEDALHLTLEQRKVVTAYAFFNRVHWLSEQGIKFNGNTYEGQTKKLSTIFLPSWIVDPRHECFKQELEITLKYLYGSPPIWY